MAQRTASTRSTQHFDALAGSTASFSSRCRRSKHAGTGPHACPVGRVAMASGSLGRWAAWSTHPCRRILDIHTAKWTPPLGNGLKQKLAELTKVGYRARAPTARAGRRDL